MERGFHRRFKLKKAFSIILVSYIAMLMVPAALAVGFSITAYHLSERRGIDEISNNIQQGELLLEERLQAMDSNVMYLAYDYTLRRMVEMEPLQPGSSNVWFVTEFHKRLNDIFADSSLLYAYGLFLKNEYVFYGNGVTQGREFYFSHGRNYAAMDYEEWYEKSFLAMERTILPLSSIKMDKETISALTYSYPIVSSLKDVREADAVVQFLIREEELRNYFLPLLNREGCQVLLLNKKGETLARLSNYEIEEIQFSADRLSESKGNMDAQIGEEPALLVYSRSDEQDLIVAAIIPELVVLEDGRRLWYTSLTMMVVSVLFELALGIYFAWKYSAPVRNLIKNVYLLLGSDNTVMQETPGEKSEYEHLESGIKQILLTNRSMQITLKEKQAKERQNFLSYLFSGEFRENEDIVREGSLIGIKLGGQLYGVASFVMEEPRRGAECLLMQEWQNVLVIDGGKEYLSVLFGFHGAKEAEKLLELVEGMAQRLRAALGEGQKAGVGRLYEDERDIHFSYKQSIYSAALQTKEAVTLYSHISQDFHSMYYPTELENKLVNTTKHAQLKQIREIFGCIRKENVEKRRLSAAMGRILISNIVATLIRVYNDVIPHEALDKLVNEILRYSEPSEALVLLEQQFIYIGEAQARSRDEQEESYQKKLAEYMSQNYSNSQFGVAMAAEEFTLSENYFSQFFKEVMGETFSTYLETLRMNKAKELIEEGSYHLEQIAGMVGYQNSGTFRRAFKRVTGIAPSAWKKVSY